MPKVALADTILEWEQIISAVNTRGLDLQHLMEQKERLEAYVAEAKALAVEQDALRARRQQVTKALRIAKRDGRDLASQIRAAVRGVYGIRSEILVNFKMRPVRRRSRSLVEEADPPAVAVRPGRRTEAPADPPGPVSPTPSES